ncbi:hypothetical protein EYC84_007027 [Monilinia fructicola]|uniref:Uncharacterized protein n=1 Tax=Monilinia fructicola TaxID=38448 RepID=A0A5M9K5U8_MONFR|nr:hypothetical protein EYC84_007027 [Monilinia fructicola]
MYGKLFVMVDLRRQRLAVHFVLSGPVLSCPVLSCPVITYPVITYHIKPMLKRFVFLRLPSSLSKPQASRTQAEHCPPPPRTPLPRPLFYLPRLDIISELLHARDEEHPLGIVFPHQDAHLLGVSRTRLVLLLALEVLEEEAGHGLHALVFQLPETDLVDDRGGQDGTAVGGRRGLDELGVRVRGEVADDLVRGDAVGDGEADRLARDAAADHVGVAAVELGEEGEDGDLQGGVGVGVETVVGLDDDEAFLAGGRLGRGVEGGRDGAQGAGVRGERRGEARGEELRGRRGGEVDEPEVDEVAEHVVLGVGEGRRAVCAAELEGAEHEEEREHIDRVHPHALGVLNPEEKQGPDLRIRFLQEK